LIDGTKKHLPTIVICKTLKVGEWAVFNKWAARGHFHGGKSGVECTTMVSLENTPAT